MSADINAVRELQSQLASVGLLISSIPHGLKGLLNGLNGGTYLVTKGLASGDQGRVVKGHIHRRPPTHAFALKIGVGRRAV